MVKIHVGSGTIYLKNFLNVDLPTPRTFLTQERSDLVARYITDEADYYGRHKRLTLEDLAQGPQESEYVCDAYGSFFFLPCRTGTATEILTRQSFEHLSLTEAHRALPEMNRALAVGGKLRIDVPDFDESLRQLMETKNPFFIRHILGPRNTKWGYHVLGHRRDSLKALVESHGFGFIREEPEETHLYPAFCLRFAKLA